MDLKHYDEIAPYIRMVKIKKSVSLTGTWEDIDHVMIYLNQGEVKCIVEGVTYTLREGDLLIMPPHARHIVMIENEEPTTQYIFHFDFFYDEGRAKIPHQSAFASEENIPVPVREGILEGKCFVAAVPEKERYCFETLFLSMYGEFAKKEFASDVMLRGMAMQFLTYCFRLRKRNSYNGEEIPVRHNKSWNTMERALEYIYLHYRDLELDNMQIAEAIEVSPNYLSKLFKKYLGMSLHKYLVSYRMEMAQRLIIRKNYNITEAALESGFASIYAFSKAFKQKRGISPSEYAAMQIKGENRKKEEAAKGTQDREDYNENKQIYYNQ